MATDPDPAVRAELLPSKPDAAVVDDIARHARSRTPPDLGALGLLGRLALDDLRPDLAAHDLERRRSAAYRLAWELYGPPVPHDLLHALLADPDPLVRSHGVRRAGHDGLRGALRELQRTERDPWVRDHLYWCLDDRLSAAEPDRGEHDF